MVKKNQSLHQRGGPEGKRGTAGQRRLRPALQSPSHCLEPEPGHQEGRGALPFGGCCAQPAGAEPEQDTARSRDIFSTKKGRAQQLSCITVSTQFPEFPTL